eukprot:6490883-Amphidinium_carterae.1
MKNVEIASGQFGLGRNAGVDYPHLIVTQLLAWSRNNDQPLGWWFIDVKTAFDRILRELLVRPGSQLCLHTLTCMGLTVSLAKKILATVSEDRPILWEHGLSPALRQLLVACLTDTWMVLPENQGDMQLTTKMGTPQGSSLSGLLFILYQQRVHSLINHYLVERGVAVILPAPDDNSFGERGCTDTMIPVVAFHDDSLVLVRADTAADLVEVVKEVVSFSMPCYEGRNLLLNWNAMKSELMVTMRTSQLTVFHATLAAEANKRAWPHPLIEVGGKQIRVVRSYNYLGRRILDTGNDVQHAKTRAAMCAGSIRQFASIYRSKSVALKHKTNLCNTLYTLSQMTHGMATLKLFDKRTDKAYSTAYLMSWKACIGSGCIDRGVFIHLTEDDILVKVKKPSWTVWADAARLRLLLRVVKADCPVLRACLMCCNTEAGSWWLALAESINRFRASLPALRDMPPFTVATRSIWLQVAALDKQQWRKWVKLYIEVDIQRREEENRAQEILPPPPLEPELLEN